MDIHDKITQILKLRIYKCAELMEWMKESPSFYVHHYLRAKGFSTIEIQEASKLYICPPCPIIQ